MAKKEIEKNLVKEQLKDKKLTEMAEKKEHDSVIKEAAPADQDKLDEPMVEAVK